MHQLCVIGDPIAHSQSPAIHARFAQLMGDAVEYTKRHVLEADLPQALRELQEQGFTGCNVTLPHKYAVAELAHTASPQVQLAGAANTLVFDATQLASTEEVPTQFSAHNTDGLGLVRDITVNLATPLAGKRVLLLGAGGAAAGALAALIQAQPAAIDVINRTASKAQRLVDSHSAYASTHGIALTALDAVASCYDVVINATAASIAGQGAQEMFALHAEHVAKDALVYDMMYGAKAQGFLSWAGALHAQMRTADGLGMLVEQAAEAYAIWLGHRPPGGQVLREMREKSVHAK